MSYIKQTFSEKFQIDLLEKSPLPVKVEATHRPQTQDHKARMQMLTAYEKKINNGTATKRDVANYNDLLEVIYGRTK